MLNSHQVQRKYHHEICLLLFLLCQAPNVSILTYISIVQLFNMYSGKTFQKAANNLKRVCYSSPYLLQFFF